jgi:hypothetical protein
VLCLRADHSVHQLVGGAVGEQIVSPWWISMHLCGLHDLHQRSSMFLLVEHHVLRHLVNFQVEFSILFVASTDQEISRFQRDTRSRRWTQKIPVLLSLRLWSSHPRDCLRLSRRHLRIHSRTLSTVDGEKTMLDAEQPSGRSDLHLLANFNYFVHQHYALLHHSLQDFSSTKGNIGHQKWRESETFKDRCRHRQVTTQASATFRCSIWHFRFFLYLRLFIVMGATWSMESISWVFDSPWFFYVSDILNCLQGFIIFILFVWKPKVKKLIVRR